MPGNKMSKEELQAAIDKSLLEAENDVPVVEMPATEDTEVAVEDTVAVETEAAHDNKQKLPSIEERYKASTQESQVLYEKTRKFNEIVQTAATLPEPDEVELRREYSDWDSMTELERRLAKDNLANRKKFELVHQATVESQKIDAWMEKVDQFLVTAVGTYPKLAGHEEEFRVFALKPTRRGLEFDDLVKIFSWDEDVAATNTKKKGSLLATGAGGGDMKPKQDKIDVKQVEFLRKNNQRLYQQLIREKKIDLSASI